MLLIIIMTSQAKPILSKGEIENLVDPRLGGAYDVTQFNRVAFAASLCIRASATCRPTMSEVAQIHLLFNFGVTFLPLYICMSLVLIYCDIRFL